MRASPQDRGALHVALQTRLAEGLGVAATLHHALKERVWDERVDEHGRTFKFASFLEYCTAKPPGGLYRNPADVRSLILADVEMLALFDAEVARPHGGDRSSKLDIVQLEPAPTGNAFTRVSRATTSR